MCCAMGLWIDSTLLNGADEEREKQVMLEIEKFRKRQAQRDK
jgi:hypothetical protein